MATFFEADQVRLQLKMKLSDYYWYCGGLVMPSSDGYGVVIQTRKIDNAVRKVIPKIVNGVEVTSIVDCRR
jgi:hypothetical protein